LLEFRSEDPRVPIKPLHKMSKAQIMKEWPPNGFKLIDEFDGLTWQHMMFFARDDAPEPAEPPPSDPGQSGSSTSDSSTSGGLEDSAPSDETDNASSLPISP